MCRDLKQKYSLFNKIISVMWWVGLMWIHIFPYAENNYCNFSNYNFINILCIKIKVLADTSLTNSLQPIDLFDLDKVNFSIQPIFIKCIWILLMFQCLTPLSTSKEQNCLRNTTFDICFFENWTMKHQKCLLSVCVKLYYKFNADSSAMSCSS